MAKSKRLRKKLAQRGGAKHFNKKSSYSGFELIPTGKPAVNVPRKHERLAITLDFETKDLKVARIAEDIRDMEEQFLKDELKAKEFLINMITTNIPDKYEEYKQDIIDAIYDADDDMIEDLIEANEEYEDWKEFYNAGFDAEAVVNEGKRPKQQEADFRAAARALGVKLNK